METYLILYRALNCLLKHSMRGRARRIPLLVTAHISARRRIKSMYAQDEAMFVSKRTTTSIRMRMESDTYVILRA